MQYGFPSCVMRHQKGQIFKYDLDTKSFDVYNLSEEERTGGDKLPLGNSSR